MPTRGEVPSPSIAVPIETHSVINIRFPYEQNKGIYYKPISLTGIKPTTDYKIIDIVPIVDT